MKNQALFSWKDKSKKLKCRLLQFLFGAFRVNYFSTLNDGKFVRQRFLNLTIYSRTSVTRTLMARLPRLFRTRY